MPIGLRFPDTTRILRRLPLLPLLLAAGLEAAPWHADWIAAAPAEERTPPDSWYAFRRTFFAAEKPAEAVVRIAVDSKYWLWVNGALVVREGGLKRGPNPRDTYHDTVDLAPHLRAGPNTIAVLVWFWGRHGFSHNDSGRCGLLFDAVVDGRPWSDAAAWRAIRHPAFGASGPPHPNFRLPEANVHFDARLDPAGWEQPGFDDSAWPPAVPLGPPPTAPWHALHPRPIPQWRDDGLRPYVALRTGPHPDGGVLLRARLPHNAQVTPHLTVAAPAGRTIDIRTDHYTGGGAPNVRTVYVTRDGIQTFETPAWMNGHEVHHHLPDDVTVLDLAYRETGYDADFAGAFGSSDPALDQLWRESARTLHVTLRDTYMDCPDRERAQWWGDVVLELGQTFYMLDRRADLLTRKAILELVDWQRPDGSLFSPVPAGNWDKELPTQMLASVGHYGFWTHLFHSGDLGLAPRILPAVDRYLALWRIGPDGLVEPRAGGWTWGDWGERKDMGLLFNGWYALALRGQAAMHRVAGDPAKAAALEAGLAALRDAFNGLCWDGAAYRSPGHAGPADDRGNGLAVVAGLAPTERFPAIREVLRTTEHASPYMEKYVLEALLQMGFVDDALARMKRRYRAMLEDDLTTLYEGWGVGAEGFGGGTVNHAWSGGPSTLLSQYVAGVAPLEPGYARFEVRPRLGPLSHVAAIVPSARGPIAASTRRRPGGLTFEIAVPAGTRATLPAPEAAGAWERIERLPADATIPVPESGPLDLGPGRWRIDWRDAR